MSPSSARVPRGCCNGLGSIKVGVPPVIVGDNMVGVGDIILLERLPAFQSFGLVAVVVAVVYSSDGESTAPNNDVLTTGLGSCKEDAVIVAAGDNRIAEDVSSFDVIRDPIEDGFVVGEFDDPDGDGDMICGSTSNSLDVLGESNNNKSLSIFVVGRLIDDSWKLLFKCDGDSSSVDV